MKMLLLAVAAAATLTVLPASPVFAADDVLVGYQPKPEDVEASRPNFGSNKDAPKLG